MSCWRSTSNIEFHNSSYVFINAPVLRWVYDECSRLRKTCNCCSGCCRDNIISRETIYSKDISSHIICGICTSSNCDRVSFIEVCIMGSSNSSNCSYGCNIYSQSSSYSWSYWSCCLCCTCCICETSRIKRNLSNNSSRRNCFNSSLSYCTTCCDIE